VLKPVKGLERTASGRYKKPEGSDGEVMEAAARRLQAGARGFKVRKQQQLEGAGTISRSVNECLGLNV